MRRAPCWKRSIPRVERGKEMSEEIINLDLVDYVVVTTSRHAIERKQNRMHLCKAVKTVSDDASNRAALANALGCAEKLDDARRSADKAKLQLLQLIRQIEDAHVTFTRDLENEMHRLRNLSGAYNAAKEQSERKDNLV